MCPSRQLCAHAEVSGCCQPHIPAHYLSTWNSHRTQAYKNMNISEQNLQRLAQSFLGVLKRSPVIGFGLHSFRKSKALANTSATTETSRNLPFDIMWHHLTSSTLPCSAKPQYLPVFAVFCPGPESLKLRYQQHAKLLRAWIGRGCLRALDHFDPFGASDRNDKLRPHHCQRIWRRCKAPSPFQQQCDLESQVSKRLVCKWMQMETLRRVRSNCSACWILPWSLGKTERYFPRHDLCS